MMTGNRHLGAIGAYRTHENAMQIVPGRLDNPTSTMKPHHQGGSPRKWRPTPSSSTKRRHPVNSPCPILPVPASAICIAKASIHLKMEMEGLAERSLKNRLPKISGKPSFDCVCPHDRGWPESLLRSARTASAHARYHRMTVYLTGTILDAQQTTLTRVALYIRKAKFNHRFHAQFNDRQEKAITRMFQKGPGGFKGGLSAENYISIRRTSRQRHAIFMTCWREMRSRAPANAGTH